MVEFIIEEVKLKVDELNNKDELYESFLFLLFLFFCFDLLVNALILSELNWVV